MSYIYNMSLPEGCYHVDGILTLASGIPSDGIIDFSGSSFKPTTITPAPPLEAIFAGGGTTITVNSTDASSNAATTEYVHNNLDKLVTISNANSTYAPLVSPALTGTPTAPTPLPTNNSDSIATTEFVKQKLFQLSVNPLLNYLTNNKAKITYAPLITPSLTGTPTVPTPPPNDSSTKIATTAYVKNSLTNYLTTNIANSTYVTISNLSNYLTNIIGNKTYASLINPRFSGTPTAPTPPTTDTSTRIATIGYITAKLLDYSTNNSSTTEFLTQSTLDNYITTNNANNTYAPLNNQALTGTPRVPTQPTSDNSTKIASTGYVKNMLDNYTAPTIPVTNNTTNTSNLLIFASGNGSQNLKNNNSLSYNASNNLLLIKNSYYLKYAPYWFGWSNPVAYRTITLTLPLSPYYTVVFGNSTGITVVLPIPSIQYSGFKITFRSTGGTLGDPNGGIFRFTTNSTNNYTVNFTAGTGGKDISGRGDVPIPTQYAEVAGGAIQDTVAYYYCIYEIICLPSETNGVYYWYGCKARSNVARTDPNSFDDFN